MKYYRLENQRVPSTLTWKRKVLYLENNQGELLSHTSLFRWVFSLLTIMLKYFKSINYFQLSKLGVLKW